MQAADAGVMKNEIYAFAEKQLNFALGISTGKSFMVGFGNNHPKKVHHRASSCPDL